MFITPDVSSILLKNIIIVYYVHLKKINFVASFLEKIFLLRDL